MLRTIPLLILLMTLLVGCSQEANRPYVRLHDLDPTLAAGDPGISRARSCASAFPPCSLPGRRFSGMVPCWMT